MILNFFRLELLSLPQSTPNKRPKSWSPNDQVAHFLMEQANRLSKSATADNMGGSGGAGQPDLDQDCNCFDQLSLQLNELMPGNSSPVNSVNNVIDPNCDCNVELELSVPNEPVSVSRRNDPQDAETDMIVQSLSQLPIQMRTSNSVLDDLR